MANKLVYFVPLMLLLPACSGDDGGSIYTASDPEMTGVTLTVGDEDSTTNSSGDGDGGEDMGDGDGDDGSDDDATTTGPKLDVLGEDDDMGRAADGGEGDGCQKVDFLFVIDNSGSMAEEQAALTASFPDFINSISSTLDATQDYHVMVIDTDAWVYAGCGVFCAFPIPVPGVCTGFTCDPPTQPELCEDVLGAGVIDPKGSVDASDAPCNFASGKRFMTDAEPFLPGAFTCAARVGTGSTDGAERPMEAMMQAVSGEGEVGICNEGFLRDDAILVVTFVTDEDDNAGDGSIGGVDVWRQALIDAKNGDESSIVVLGLFGDDDLPNPICNGGAETSPRLRQFLDSWGTNGFFGSICAASYNDFFQEAVDIIDTTCDEFDPPK